MPIGARIPPGRAGHLWLARRLRAATRGREQLDRKLRILLPELDRQHRRAARCQADWSAACAELRTWASRATLLGGQDALRHGTPTRPASIRLSWTAAVGVRYPGDATFGPAPADGDLLSDNAAVAPARAAAAAALLAGARAAAAAEAVRRLEAEVAVTRRRLRALDRRWLPWLRDARAALEIALEQAEREDGVRLRLTVGAAGRRPRP